MTPGLISLSAVGPLASGHGLHERPERPVVRVRAGMDRGVPPGELGAVVSVVLRSTRKVKRDGGDNDSRSAFGGRRGWWAVP
jgi:hypothetical protein